MCMITWSCQGLIPGEGGASEKYQQGVEEEGMQLLLIKMRALTKIKYFTTYLYLIAQYCFPPADIKVLENFCIEKD